MKLLMLCMNYAPESTGIAPFTTALSQELVQRGHQVTVATTFPHYPEWQTYEPYRGKWFLTENIRGVTVRRTRVYLPRHAGTMERVLYDTSLGIGNFLAGMRVRDVDLILVVEPPIQTGVAGRLLATIRGLPYAIWIQDLALEAAMSVGMMRPSFAMRIAQRLETWAHARAEKIYAISQGFLENLGGKGVPHSKLEYQPNWVNAEPSEIMSDTRSFRQMYGICEQAVMVLHSGNMGVKQQLENVLDAAVRLRTQDNICFVMVGDGSQKTALVERAKQANLTNVHFLPLQPHAAVPEMMAAADILLVNQHPDLVEAVIPSKLLTYMMAGRAVVIAAHAESEAARLVQTGECGVVVAPNQPDALAQAIVSLADDPQRRAVLGQHGRAYVEKNFARGPRLDAFEASLSAQAAQAHHA